MSRKHKDEDHLNHEAWAIPYADLMTLLLAFFVVMYAVSAVNEGKYRVMSQSMTEAFNGSSQVIAPLPQAGAAHHVTPAMVAPPGQAGAAALPIAIPLPARPAPVRMVDARKPAAKSPPQASVTRTVDAQQENLGRIQNQVQHALQPLIDKQMVVVRRTANWLEIEIRTDILFPSGVAQLTHPADAVLGSLAGILAPFPNPLRVEGYTDDKPINTAVYPSNWELSAARAASVARLFSNQGVSPSRMGIIGWGQFRPAADNTTVEGRNRNRRVLVVVLSDHATPTRYYSDADHPGELADAPAAKTPDAGGDPSLASQPPQATAPSPAAVLADAGVLAPTTSLTQPSTSGRTGLAPSASKPSGAPVAASAALLLSPGTRP